ncbi:YetF domain-containing protein [Methylobacterium sp. P31]
MGLHWILAHGAARFRSISRILEGGPIPLAEGGTLDAAKLRRDGISAADLDEALRQVSIEQVGQTRLIMLEPSGKITVLKA